MELIWEVNCSCFNMFHGGSLLLLVSLVRASNKTAAFIRPHRLETKMHCELTAEGKSGFAP